MKSTDKVNSRTYDKVRPKWSELDDWSADTQIVRSAAKRVDHTLTSLCTDPQSRPFNHWVNARPGGNDGEET